MRLMRQHKHFLTAIIATAFATLLAITLQSAGLGLLTAQSADSKIKPNPRIAVNDRGKIYHDECIVLGKEVQSPYRDCVYGDPKSDKHVVLFGDSHALQYGPTMIQLARKNDWRLTALIRQGCPVAQVNLEPVCNEWRNNTMRRIVRRERPDVVVVSTATTGRYKVKVNGNRLTREQSQPYLIRGMVFTLKRLRDTMARVFVIRDQHLAPQKPPPCVQRNYNRPNQACAWRPDNRRDRQGFDYEAARRVKKVRVFDPVTKYCPESWCPVVKGNFLLYRDRYHITATYARHIAPWMERNMPPVQKRKGQNDGGKGGGSGKGGGGKS